MQISMVLGAWRLRAFWQQGEMSSCPAKHLETAWWDLGRAPTREQITETKRQILNIIPHHCSDHSGCNDPEKCGFIRMKLEKGFTVFGELASQQKEELLDEMASCKGCSCFDCNLQLDTKEQIRLLHEVTLRFNQKSIPGLAKSPTTNSVESLWS